MPEQNKHWQLERVKGHPGYWRNPVSGVIYWRGTIKGKKFKKSTGETAISRAREYIDDFILRLTSTNIERSKREQAGVVNPRISDIWHEAVGRRLPTCAASTAKRYEIVWRIYLKPFWGECHVSDVNQNKVLAFEAEFRRLHKEKSYGQVKKYLGMLLNYLVKEKYLDASLVVQDLDRAAGGYAKKRKHFRVYNEDELTALVENAKNIRTLAGLIGYQDTGARKMELLSATREQVNFNENTMRLWSQKNKEWRTVPLTKRFKKALTDLIDSSPQSEYLFPAPRDPKAHISSQVFDKDWVKTKKASGIRGRARIHDLRHTVATRTADLNWPTKYACEFLDMSANVYLNTYVHTNAQGLLVLFMKTFEGARRGV